MMRRLTVEGRLHANAQRKEVGKDGYYYNLTINGLYRPAYGFDAEFDDYYQSVKDVTDMGIERLWVIYLMAKQSRHVAGSFFECGVFRGGSAALIAKTANGRKALHLFDTFAGMPECDAARDDHIAGDFSDVSLEQVKRFVGREQSVMFHQGVIPDTFAGMEDERIAFAHVDVDIYRSMKDCCEFIYPRMTVGGVIVFDDYGQFTCRGARDAIDEYFDGRHSVPLPLITKQAIVFKI